MKKIFLKFALSLGICLLPQHQVTGMSSEQLCPIPFPCFQSALPENVMGIVRELPTNENTRFSRKTL
ncbi:MAG: hypothetical protein K6C34_03755 [Alphaproteobacteria bacterium]|nr:hypothetical protein [Alphaproteobacteria bacterium]